MSFAHFSESGFEANCDSGIASLQDDCPCCLKVNLGECLDIEEFFPNNELPYHPGYCEESYHPDELVICAFDVDVNVISCELFVDDDIEINGVRVSENCSLAYAIPSGEIIGFVPAGTKTIIKMVDYYGGGNFVTGSLKFEEA
jgi:hypothetical protein